jgi:hypothetical protein
LCAYLADRAADGITVASLNVACSAIGHQHRSHGVADPVAHESVRRSAPGCAVPTASRPAGKPGR